MATQPPQNMPLFYNSLQPLTSNVHGSYRSRTSDKAPFFAKAHAVPLTTDEFVQAQRSTPIVFSVGENPIPLALMGLNEGVNVFVDEDGRPHAPFYVPAYVRRYPWVLARLQQNAQELTLCFDPTTDLVGEFEDGAALFEDGQPSETLNSILKFCEEFETAGQRTQGFMRELHEMDLLIDGEITIQPNDSNQPFVYRGFRMVDEQRFRALSAETLARIHENGILPLIVAHLFSLSLMRDVFGRQMQQGKVPDPAQQPVVSA